MEEKLKKEKKICAGAISGSRRKLREFSKLFKNMQGRNGKKDL